MTQSESNTASLSITATVAMAVTLSSPGQMSKAPYKAGPIRPPPTKKQSRQTCSTRFWVITFAASLYIDFCQTQSCKMLCEIQQNKVQGLGCETGENINQYRLQGGRIPTSIRGPHPKKGSAGDAAF